MILKQKINIEIDTIIYVACPANSATGGPELLHQFVHELVNLGFNARIFYYRRTDKHPVHESYLDYEMELVDVIEDEKNNILIVPETYTELLYQFTNIRKVIWWLSVDNYFGFLNADYRFVKMVKNFLFNLNIYPLKKIYKFNNQEQVIHFVQSEYAKQMLKSKGISDCYFLGDYLNKLFIEKQLSNDVRKENIVIYNPKKGIKFTKKIIKNSNNISFVPIENMTREEVANLLSKAKVYIDFGNHPGKDRIPREALISGCCVIVGKSGSANFYEDVSLENEFKFALNDKDIPLIVKKIIDCLDNYEVEVKKNLKYLESVKNEQSKFIEDINKIFKVNK